MLLLQSNESYDDLLKFDPNSGESELTSRGANPERVAIQGHFVNLSGEFTCLYRWHDKMFFRLGKCAYEIPENATAELREEGDFKTLRILLDDLEICHWTYPKPKYDLIDALRYFDEEHTDFGLLVHNVINDKGRQQRIYR